MPGPNNVPDAADFVRRARALTLAHAYLVIGSPEGDGLAFVQTVLQGLYCDRRGEAACGTCRACRLVAGRKHADIVWIEPESRSRRILIDQIRPLARFLSLSAYEGHWKTGVLLAADRMTEQASNAFLKTLEEPPSESLLLMVTDIPEALLPTVRSRCQRLVARTGGETIPPWQEDLLRLLAEDLPQGRLDRMLWNERFRALLARETKQPEEEAEESEDSTAATRERRQARQSSRIRRIQREMLGTIQRWRRDVFLLVNGADTDLLFFQKNLADLRSQADALNAEQALHRLRRVDLWARRLEHHLPLADVLDADDA